MTLEIGTYFTFAHSRGVRCRAKVVGQARGDILYPFYMVVKYVDPAGIISTGWLRTIHDTHREMTDVEILEARLVYGL